MNKIKLNPFSIFIEINGYWKGFSLTRAMTLSEALHIADRALGVNVTLIKDDWKCRIKEEKEDVIEEKKEFIFEVQGLITGENTWDGFCDRWTCGEGLEDINPSMFIQMIYICQKKGIIK